MNYVTNCNQQVHSVNTNATSVVLKHVQMLFQTPSFVVDLFTFRGSKINLALNNTEQLFDTKKCLIPINKLQNRQSN